MTSKMPEGQIRPTVIAAEVMRCPKNQVVDQKQKRGKTTTTTIIGNTTDRTIF